MEEKKSLGKELQVEKWREIDHHGTELAWLYSFAPFVKGGGKSKPFQEEGIQACRLQALRAIAFANVGPSLLGCG